MSTISEMFRSNSVGDDAPVKVGEQVTYRRKMAGGCNEIVTAQVVSLEDQTAVINVSTARGGSGKTMTVSAASLEPIRKRFRGYSRVVNQPWERRIGQ
ncbi:MAG: hypothetical protein KGL39_13580 [Patescibacteria group bacterium]|nr:hypothetical protein [Patescibacteria group bacterium]